MDESNIAKIQDKEGKHNLDIQTTSVKRPIIIHAKFMITFTMMARFTFMFASFLGRF
jgi:hypothetical protein